MLASLKVFLIFITIVYLLLIIKLIKKRELNINFSIFWIFAGIALIGALIIMLIVPGVMGKISRMLGFEVPANMVFCISIFTLFYIGLDLTWKISKENKKSIILTQEISLLKERVNKLEENLNERK